MKFTFLFSMFGLAGLVFAVTPAGAATMLTADGSSLNVTAVPPPGVIGYDFFAVDGGSDLSSLPSFVTNVTSDVTGRYSDPTYSTLTIAGTPHHTGVIYQSKSSGAIATITLGAGVPGNFILGLLANSTSDGPSNNTVYTVTDDLDSAMVTVNSPKPSGTVDQNDFFYINVVGATAGETLTISGNATQITLGGITFDTPEPAPIVALAGLGGMGLIVLATRRRRAAARGTKPGSPNLKN